MTGNGGHDQPGLASDGNAMLQQTGWRGALFVEAQQTTSRATAWIFHRQLDGCCKSCNRPILVGSLGGWTVAGPVQWLWLVASCYVRQKQIGPFTDITRRPAHK